MHPGERAALRKHETPVSFTGASALAIHALTL